MRSHSCSEQRSLSYLVLASLLAAVCGLFTLAGCASMESASQESLLTSAGFQARTPSTPKQKAAFAALPPYQLHRGTWKGRTVYAYKDEKAGVAYIGNKANYAQFQQLAAKAKLAEEKQVAHNMDNDLVYRWYGSWDDFGAASPVD